MEEWNEATLCDWAIDLQLLTREHIAACIEIQARMKEQGHNIPVDRILIQKGFINEDQIAYVKQAWQQKTNRLQETQEQPRTVIVAPEDSERTVILNNGQANSGQSFATTPSPNVDMKQGKKIGKYEVIKEIGRGGMGRVYKAHDPTTNQHVAVKILITGDLAKDDDIKRFLREAKTSEKLVHPNIVRFFEVGCENQVYYIAMEYVDGCSIREYVQQEKPSYEQIARLMIQVGQGLQVAHDNGVIHRDLKPANIMVDRSGQPKIMDFGLAKAQQESQQLSRTGMILGTLQYMPPEQAEGNLKAIDERSDVYGLGAILYEMLTGQPPFSGDSTLFLLNQILTKKTISPSKINPTVPKALENVCNNALQKRKALRYPSANAWAKALEAALPQLGSTNAPTSSPKRVSKSPASKSSVSKSPVSKSSISKSSVSRGGVSRKELNEISKTSSRISKRGRVPDKVQRTAKIRLKKRKDNHQVPIFLTSLAFLVLLFLLYVLLNQ